MSVLQTNDAVKKNAFSMESIDEIRRFITMISKVDTFLNQMTQKDIALKLLMSLCKRFEILLGNVYFMTAGWYSIGGIEDFYDAVRNVLVDTADETNGKTQQKFAECIEKVSEQTPNASDNGNNLDITSSCISGCTKPTNSEHCEAFEGNETNITMKEEPYSLRSKDARIQCKEAYCSTKNVLDDCNVTGKDDSQCKQSIPHGHDACVMCTASLRGKRHRKQPCPKRNLNLCDVKTAGKMFSSSVTEETDGGSIEIQRTDSTHNLSVNSEHCDMFEGNERNVVTMKEEPYSLRSKDHTKNINVAIVKVKPECFKTTFGDNDLDESDTFENAVPSHKLQSDQEHRNSAEDIEVVPKELDKDRTTPVSGDKRINTATYKHSYSFRKKNQWTHVKNLRNKKQPVSNKAESIKLNSLKKSSRFAHNFTSLKSKKFQQRQSVSSKSSDKKLKTMVERCESVIGNKVECHPAKVLSVSDIGADKYVENIVFSDYNRNGNSGSNKSTFLNEEQCYNDKCYKRTKSGEQCTSLNKKVTNVSLMKDASQAYNGSNKIACRYCGRSFSRWTILYRHYRMHPEGAFACLRCGVISGGSEQLAQHMDDHKLMSKFQCKSCGKMFDAIAQYNTHMAGHVVNQCDQCEVNFSTRNELASHRRKEHKEHASMRAARTSWPRGISELHCRQSGTSELDCRQSSTSELDCRQSGTSELGCRRSGISELDCRQSCISELDCTQSGTSELYCRQSGISELDCHACGRSFNNRTLLLAHKRSHALEELPFRCEPCKLNFFSNKALISHLSTKSHCSKAGETPVGNRFLCQECGKVFSRKFGLQRHMRYHRNSKVYKCRFCDFTSREQNNLQNHMKLHFENQRNFVCEICGAAFHTKRTLDLHRTFKHSDERKFSCTTCARSFKTEAVLKRHCKIHLNQKDHVCFCGKAFLRLCNFRRHLKMVHGTEDMLAPANHVAILDCAKKIPVSKTDLSRDLVDQSTVEDMYGKVNRGVEVSMLVDDPEETISDKAESEQDDTAEEATDNLLTDTCGGKLDSRMNDRKSDLQIHHTYSGGGKWTSFNSDLPEQSRNAEPGMVAADNSPEYGTDLAPTSNYLSVVSQHGNEPTLPRLSQMVFTQRLTETGRIPYEHSDSLPSYADRVNTSLTQEASVADSLPGYADRVNTSLTQETNVADSLPGYADRVNTSLTQQTSVADSLPGYADRVNTSLTQETSVADSLPGYADRVNTSLTQQTSVADGAHAYSENESSLRVTANEYPYSASTRALLDRQRALQEDLYVRWANEEFAHTLIQSAHGLAHSEAQEEHGQHVYNFTPAAPVPSQFINGERESVSTSMAPQNLSLSHPAGDYIVDMTNASYSQPRQELVEASYSQTRTELTDTGYSQSGQELVDARYSQSRPELTDASYSQTRPELTDTSYSQTRPELTDANYSHSGQEISAVDLRDTRYSQSGRELEDAHYSQSRHELADASYSQSRQGLEAVDMADGTYSHSSQDLSAVDMTDASYSQSRRELAAESLAQMSALVTASGYLPSEPGNNQML